MLKNINCQNKFLFNQSRYLYINDIRIKDIILKINKIDDTINTILYVNNGHYILLFCIFILQILMLLKQIVL